MCCGVKSTKMAENIIMNRRDYRFVTPPPNEFCCCICTEVLNDPVEISSCDHLYCRSCITTWLQTKPSCPQCQRDATESSLKEANRYLRSYIGNLHVYCPEKDCNKIMAISELEHHLESCGKREGTTAKCDRCGHGQFPGASTSHDCVEILKGNLKELESTVSDLENELQAKSVQLASCNAEKKKLEIQVQNCTREIQALKYAKPTDDESQLLKSKAQARVLGELYLEKRMHEKSQEEASVLRERLSALSRSMVRQAQALEVEIRKGFAKVETADGVAPRGAARGDVGPQEKKRPLLFSLRDVMHDMEFAKDSEISTVLKDIRKFKSLCDRRIADIGKSTARKISLKDSLGNFSCGAKKRSSSVPPSSVLKKFEALFRFSCNFELDMDMVDGGKLVSSFYRAEGFKWQIIVKRSRSSLSLFVRSEPEDKSLEKSWKVGYQLKLLRQGWGQPRTFTQYGEMFTPTSNIHGFREFCRFGKQALSPAKKDVLEVQAIFFRVIVSKQPPKLTLHLPLLSFAEIEAVFTNKHVQRMQENDEMYSPPLVNFNNEVKLVMKRTQLCQAFPSQLAVFLHFFNEATDQTWINKFDIKLRIRGPKKTASCTLIPPHPITDGQMIGGPMLEWSKLLNPAFGFMYDDGAILAETFCNLHQDIPVTDTMMEEIH
ncbi:unnamed protein product [Cyprideis torosa]|uniref:Uncharacterized protein n=1 Tax=Cyprideis torosa TaxID=163714 RepID=A0A7R8WKE8_9CRUS|nr:unnamed protein product [Cyprideis torosa]CAG0895992.1 unnamed protein product [Cyprideis torosa]